MKLRTLTNVRPTKDLGTQVMLAPTSGQFKVTPDAARKLEVGVGEYVGVVYDDEGKQGFVFKGEEGMGGKLASSNKGGGGILTFSSAAGWDELDGSEEHNTHFDIADEPVDMEELEGTPYEGKKLFALIFSEKVEKQARKASDKSEDDSNADADADAEKGDSAASPAASFDDI